MTTYVGRLRGPVLDFRRMMDHDQATASFSEYVDGELPAARRGELEQHLKVCIQCRTGLEAFRRTVGSLGRLKTGAPPAFLAGVQRQIHTRSRGRFFGRRWLLFGRIPFEWVSLGMIVIMLVYYLLVLQSSPAGVTPAAP